MIPSDRLQKLLEGIPLKPGVYFMRNSGGEIIYVGKSRKLKNRVRSYFSGKHTDSKTRMLVASIDDISFIVTGTEIEALILENNLIKKHKPRYNVMLKDSKTHPYLCVAMSEPFPRLLKVRKVSFKDGNLYFGPFPDEYGLKRIIELFNRKFRLCRGKTKIDPGRKNPKPCLEYHLKACHGACLGQVTEADYRALVENVLHVLSGKEALQIDELKHEMEELGRQFRFEEAAEVRDTITAFENFFSRQKVEFVKPIDSDIWGLAETVDRLVVSVFFVRAGKLLGHRSIDIEREPRASVAGLLGSVMTRFYDGNLVPGRILTSVKPFPLGSLKEFLFRLSGRKPRIGVPRAGSFRRLMKMADENAVEVLKNLKSTEGERVAEGVLDLERRLSLPRTPFRVECVDISHTQGTDPVASLVVAINGEPRRGEYRLFHIKTARGGDDPASIGEVTERRFTRILKDHGPLCDLFVVDGGITQARAAREKMKELGVDRPVWGLAKREELLVPPDGEPVRMPLTCPAMRLLAKLRNEAHRFANTFERKIHSRRTVRSALLNLPGIGGKTIQKVFATFGSLKKAALFTPEEMARQASIPLKSAQLILAYLNVGADSPSERQPSPEPEE